MSDRGERAAPSKLWSGIAAVSSLESKADGVDDNYQCRAVEGED